MSGSVNGRSRRLTSWSAPAGDASQTHDAAVADALVEQHLVVEPAAELALGMVERDPERLGLVRVIAHRVERVVVRRHRGDGSSDQLRPAALVHPARRLAHHPVVAREPRPVVQQVVVELHLALTRRRSPARPDRPPASPACDRGDGRCRRPRVPRTEARLRSSSFRYFTCRAAPLAAVRHRTVVDPVDDVAQLPEHRVVQRRVRQRRRFVVAPRVPGARCPWRRPAR